MNSISIANQDTLLETQELLYINDLATFGENSYCYDNIEIMSKLSQNKYALMHKIINIALFNYVIEKKLHFGKMIEQYSDIDKNINWEAFNTFEDIMNDTEAMTAISNSVCVLNAINNSQIAMSVLAKNKTAVKIICTSNIDKRRILIQNDYFVREIAKQSFAEKRYSKQADLGVGGDSTVTYTGQNVLLIAKLGQHSFNAAKGDIVVNGVQYTRDKYVVFADYNTSSITATTDETLSCCDAVVNGGTLANLGGYNRTVYGSYGLRLNI